MVPDVLKEGIFSSTARFKFLPRENRIVDFAPELTLKLSHGFCQDFLTRIADHEHIEVAGSILLVTCERAIKICLVYPFNLFEAFCDPGDHTNGFRYNIRTSSNKG